MILESYLNENNITSLQKIIDFNDLLNTFDYGLIDNKKHKLITDFPDNKFINLYRTISPKDFEKYKGGVCWDYVEYERYYFNKYFKDIKFKTYYIELKDMMSSTHTFLVFHYNNNSYYFESSWYNYRGIYEFNNDNDIINIVLSRMIANDRKQNIKVHGYKIIEYNKPKKFGMTCLEYMEYMDSQKVINNI